MFSTMSKANSIIKPHSTGCLPEFLIILRNKVCCLVQRQDNFNPLPTHFLLERAWKRILDTFNQKRRVIEEGYKILWEKGKMQVTIIFFFSLSVIKRLFIQGH